MAGEWRETELQAVADEITVGHVGPMASEYVESGIPFLRSLNVEPFRVNEADIKYITPEFHAKLKKSVLRPGDVVIVRTGKPGATAVIPEWLTEANCSDLVIVRPGNKLDRRFLVYVMNSVAQRHVAAHLVGAVQQHFNVGSARTLRLHLPPLREQQAIACILGAFDDKIELNRRRNRTLEAMARAIFQSWFVDFDPVKAKAAGRTPPGLSPALAALFPDSFTDSQIGPIPTGWRVESILEIADLLSGGTPKTSESSYWDGDIPWASAKDVSQCGESFLIDTERTITQEGLQNSATQIIPAFSSVVVARGATTGRMTMFGHDIAMNQTCYALKSKFDAHCYLYLLLRHEIEAIVHTAHGSVFDTITTATFRASKVCVAAQELVRAFDDRISPVFGQILSTSRQSRTLAALRDALLPKLISGELRVPDADRMVGRAV